METKNPAEVAEDAGEQADPQTILGRLEEEHGPGAALVARIGIAVISVHQMVEVLGPDGESAKETVNLSNNLMAQADQILGVSKEARDAAGAAVVALINSLADEYGASLRLGSGPGPQSEEGEDGGSTEN